MNKTVNSNSKEILPIVKTVENCDLDVESTILCVSAQCVVQSTEVINKELRINCVTSYRIITVDDDGEYDLVIRRNENTVSITNENVTPSAKTVIFANVTDCSYTAKDDGRATAEIEISGWILKENELEFLENAADTVFCRTGKYEIENVACLDDSYLTLTNSNEARLPVKKILDCSTHVTVNNVYPAQGSFQTEGDVVIRIVALSDSGIFITQSFVLPFSTEIQNSCATPDSVIDVYAQATKTDITVTDGDARVFISDVEIKFLYAISEKATVDGIIDCYSKSKDLVTTEKVNVVNTCTCYRAVRDKVSAYVKSGSVIEEIYCVNAPYVSDVSVIINDSLKVEGLLTATLVYSAEDGIKTEKCEMPFSIAVSGDFDCRETFFPEIKITALSARLRSATEAEITAELFVAVRGTNRHEIKLVSSIEEGGDKTDSEYAISLYIVKPGETVWDVAKALNTDEETIFRLNPELAVPLKGGEKIIVYNELVFDI